MKKTYIIIFLSLFVTLVKSQIIIDTAYFYSDTNSKYYFPKTKIHINEINTNTMGVFKSFPYYTLQKGSEFLFEGKKYLRYDQCINSIRVIGNSYFISTLNDTILNITGKVAYNQIQIPNSIIATNTAIQNLITSLNFYKYKWQDTLWEQSIQEESNDSLASYYPKTSLYIERKADINFDSTNNYSFSYPILISALASAQDSVYFDSLYFINPVNGNILKRTVDGLSLPYSGNINSNNLQNGTLGKSNSSVNNINSCSGSCELGYVTTHYYGGQNVYSSKFNDYLVCRFRLKENCNGATIYVRKRKSSVAFQDYRSDNPNWPQSGDKVGITAMWCAERIYETYANLFNFFSFDNQYKQFNVYIDNSPQGKTQWQTNNKQMNVNFFKGTNSYHAVLDVMGREFHHGVLNSTTELGKKPFPTNINNNDYNTQLIQAQENTIAEGFCDVLGQVVEFNTYSNYSTSSSNINDFVTGGDRPGGYSNGETRSLINPNQTGNPATVLGTNFSTPFPTTATNKDVEDNIFNNSTIIGHWFYLLAIGGNGNNGFPYYNNFCVKPIGQYNAGKIAFLTSTNFIGNFNKNFIGARDATIMAATQLFGANSNEVAQTTEAWYAVGVGSKYNGQIDIKNVTINTAYNSNYNAKIQLQNVTVNNGSLDVSSNTEIELLPNTNINNGAIADLYIAPPNPCTDGARVMNTNGGGKDADYDLDLTTIKNVSPQTQTQFEFHIIPNPNNGTFKLTLNNNNELPKTITIIDAQGRVTKTIQNPTEYEYNFSINELNNGLYIINALYNGKSISKRFVKN